MPALSEILNLLSKFKTSETTTTGCGVLNLTPRPGVVYRFMDKFVSGLNRYKSDIFQAVKI